MTAAKAAVKAKQERRIFPARVKCEAILAVWSERRKPSEICRELGVNWSMLNHWQNRAMAGMLQALEPKTQADQQQGPALGPKLEQLLEKTSRRVEKFARLEQRLEKIQNQAE